MLESLLEGEVVVDWVPVEAEVESGGGKGRRAKLNIRDPSIGNAEFRGYCVVCHLPFSLICPFPSHPVSVSPRRYVQHPRMLRWRLGRLRRGGLLRRLCVHVRWDISVMGSPPECSPPVPWHIIHDAEVAQRPKL